MKKLDLLRTAHAGFIQLPPPDHVLVNDAAQKRLETHGIVFAGRHAPDGTGFGFDATGAQALRELAALLWRANRKRLEAEPLRDAILYLGGTLDLTPREGSPVADKAQAIAPQGREVGRRHFLNDLKDDTTHRSIYLPIVRGAQMPMMQCFNAADPGLVIGARSASISPVQSLLLMNSDQVMTQAQGFAKRAMGPTRDARIAQVWKMACGRAPTTLEIQTMRGFIAAAGDNPEGWTQLCHAVMQSGEFQVVD